MTRTGPHPPTGPVRVPAPGVHTLDRTAPGDLDGPGGQSRRLGLSSPLPANGGITELYPVLTPGPAQCTACGEPDGPGTHCNGCGACDDQPCWADCDNPHRA